MTNEEKLAAKRAEVEHYAGVLERYGRGRWYWSYRRREDELKAELAELERLVSIDGDTPPS